MARYALSEEEKKQVEKLDRGFADSLSKLTSFSSKYKARNEETERLRNEARKAGIEGDELRKIKANTSPYLHYSKTIDEYKNILHRYSIWVTIQSRPRC